MYVVSLADGSAIIGLLRRELNDILSDAVPTSHVECTYSPATSSWSVPTVINNPNLQINGFAVGLNYGGPYYESLTGDILHSSLLTRVTQHTDFSIC